MRDKCVLKDTGILSQDRVARWADVPPSMRCLSVHNWWYSRLRNGTLAWMDNRDAGAIMVLSLRPQDQKSPQKGFQRVGAEASAASVLGTDALLEKVAYSAVNLRLVFPVGQPWVLYPAEETRILFPVGRPQTLLLVEPPQ